jgi:hypothetical protein
MGVLYAFDLTDIILKYDLEYYFETGTGIGECLEYALRYPFKELYSVDIDDELIKAARNKFAETDKDLKLFTGTSEDILREHVPSLPKDSPTLFFLDAHFPGADFHKISYEESIRTYKEVAFPLEEEIKIIQEARDTSRDVIILDDLMLYEPSDKYEHKGWEYGWLQEELNLATSSQFIYDAFQETHNFTKDYRNQGYLVITPKEK